MEIEHNLNFNNPLELTVIFRSENRHTKKTEEYGHKLAVGWENIKTVEEYAFKDDWELYKGEKYIIELYDNRESRLILGSYDTMINYWRQFRNEFPLFVKPNSED